MAGGSVTFANGTRSLFNCPRCGFDVPYPEIRKDGQRGDYVCSSCWDPKHPLEIIPKDIYDPVSLRHPRKELRKRDDTYVMGPVYDTLYYDTPKVLFIQGAVGNFSVTVT